MHVALTSLFITVLVVLVVVMLLWWALKSKVSSLIPKVIPSQFSSSIARLANAVDSPQCEVLCSRINNPTARRACINRCLERQFRALCRADCDNDRVQDRAQCYYNCNNASL